MFRAGEAGASRTRAAHAPPGMGVAGHRGMSGGHFGTLLIRIAERPGDRLKVVSSTMPGRVGRCRIRTELVGSWRRPDRRRGSADGPGWRSRLAGCGRGIPGYPAAVLRWGVAGIRERNRRTRQPATRRC